MYRQRQSAVHELSTLLVVQPAQAAAGKLSTGNEEKLPAEKRDAKAPRLELSTREAGKCILRKAKRIRQPLLLGSVLDKVVVLSLPEIRRGVQLWEAEEMTIDLLESPFVFDFLESGVPAVSDMADDHEMNLGRQSRKICRAVGFTLHGPIRNVILFGFRDVNTKYQDKKSRKTMWTDNPPIGCCPKLVRRHTCRIDVVENLISSVLLPHI
jgi:hypothetical protein